MPALLQVRFPARHGRGAGDAVLEHRHGSWRSGRPRCSCWRTSATSTGPRHTPRVGRHHSHPARDRLPGVVDAVGLLPALPAAVAGRDPAGARPCVHPRHLRRSRSEHLRTSRRSADSRSRSAGRGVERRRTGTSTGSWTTTRRSRTLARYRLNTEETRVDQRLGRPRPAHVVRPRRAASRVSRSGRMRGSRSVVLTRSELDALPRWKSGILIKNARFFDDHRDIIKAWQQGEPVI